MVREAVSWFKRDGLVCWTATRQLHWAPIKTTKAQRRQQARDREARLAEDRRVWAKVMAEKAAAGPQPRTWEDRVPAQWQTDLRARPLDHDPPA